MSGEPENDYDSSYIPSTGKFSLVRCDPLRQRPPRVSEAAIQVYRHSILTPLYPIPRPYSLTNTPSPQLPCPISPWEPRSARRSQRARVRGALTPYHSPTTSSLLYLRPVNVRNLIELCTHSGASQ